MLHLFVWAMIFGFSGQLLRSLIGLQKMFRAEHGFVGFSLGRFLISLGIGIAGGFIGALTYAPEPGITGQTAGLSFDELNRNFMLITLGAGYAGSDFVEGALGQRSPRR